MMMLYIDPGTGSMLFSIVISLVAMLFFLWKAFWLKLKLIFSSGRVSVQNASFPFVIYNENKRYWSTFEPIVEEFELRGISLVYLTSAADDPIFLRSYSFIAPEFIGVGNKAFARLNMLEADVVLMTTPGLDVYQLKRSKSVKHYAHVLHAVSDATSYRLFGLDYFDSILLTGAYQEKDIRELEAQRHLPAKTLVVVGCPYLDVIQQRLIREKPDKDALFTVLLAPSWGYNGILRKFGTSLLDPLAESGFRVIVRPHPQSVESEWAEILPLREKYADNPLVEWDLEPDNFVSLYRSDIMISDFSGVMFDYAFLFDKPFLYVNADFDSRPYDFGCIEEKPWKFRVLSEIGVELHEADFPLIALKLQEITSDPQLPQRRLSARDVAWQYRGESGARTVEFLVSIQRQLYSELEV